MTRTGKLNWLTGLIFSLFFVSSTVFGQDVSVSSSLSETNIYSGESVTMTISVSGQSINNIERPQMPPVDGLRWLSGSTSTSQRIELINGRPTVSYSYGYSFIAQRPGTYTFPELTIGVDGKGYTTKPISFNVLDPGSIDNDQSARLPDIYVRLEPSTTQPALGEMVIADIVLYFKNTVEVRSYQPTPGWKAEGFWKEILENRLQTKATSTLINGVRFQRARLLQYALFPTKSGELTISPFELSVQIQQRNRRRDIFSFGLGQERKDLQTLPVTLTVRSLPDIDNATFTGGVGDFKITRTIEPAEAFVGESIEVTTTISGSGNLPLLNKPIYEYPETLEIYNPSESSNINRNNREISGSKTFTDILIARNAGEFTIPETNVAFYDPDNDRYRTISLPALTLKATRDPRSVNGSEDMLRLNVEPITGLAQWITPDNAPLTSRSWIWGLLLSPVVILGLAFWVKSYRDKMNTDTAFARAQKAKKLATEELEKAAASTELKNGYYHIYRAISLFIADKLDLPKAGNTTSELVQAVEDSSSSKLAIEVKRLLTKCDTIAYAPGASQAGMARDVEFAQTLINELNKAL